MVGLLLCRRSPNLCDVQHAVGFLTGRSGPVASRKLVSQPAPSVRLQAIWSSFPVEVESEALSSATEASLR
jgi:hypothetical protein